MKKIIMAALAVFAVQSYTVATPAYAEACDVAKGKKIFKRCKACHKLEEGKNGIGPNLFQIVNRPVASVDEFTYSPAMIGYAEGGKVWDQATFDVFITKPKKEVKGTNMQFGGLKKEAQRNDLFCYLEKEAGATE